MAAKEMYDYLPVTTADYATPLTNPSQVLISERGLKNQFVNLGDDGSEERISLSSDSIFYVSVQWPNKSESDIGQIVDYYHDTTKGNGMARTFQWTHPSDGHVYVVRFNCDVTRTIRRSGIHGIPNCEFKVLGTIS